MVKKITKEEIIEKINRGEKFKLIDGKDTPDYEDKKCPAKTIAAKRLLDMGYPKVFTYEGSWKEWKESGYPVE